MRYHKLPKELKVRVRNYFYHRYNGRLFNEKTMLKELSHVLEEVYVIIYSTTKSMNLFKCIINVFVGRKLQNTTTGMC